MRIHFQFCACAIGWRMLHVQVASYLPFAVHLETMPMPLLGISQVTGQQHRMWL